ncbi:MAG: PAS domain S-box protein [Burkholderiales bacterium]
MAESGNGERSGDRRWLRARSLRWWGVVALAAFELTIVGVFATDRVAEFRAAETDARLAMQGYARIVAYAVDRQIREQRALLEAIARRPGLMPRPGSGCAAVFAEFAELRPDLGALVLVGADGATRCATWPASRISRERDADWLRPITEGASFAAGRVSSSAEGGAWGVPIAVAVRHPDGRIAGALSARIELSSFRPADPAALGLPASASIDLVDESGVVLTHSGAPGRVGASAGADELGRLVRGEEGWRARDGQGVDIVAGAARLETMRWHAIAQTPASWALAGARARLEANLVVGALLLVLGTAVAVLLIRRAALPVEAVARIAEGVAGGDTTLRVAETGGPAELARIERGFNAMLDRLDAERAAWRESEERFRTVVEASSDPVLVVDRDNRIRFASRASEAVLGWAPADLVGRDLSVLQPERLAAVHLEALRRYAATGTRRLDWRQLTTIAVHRDGHEFPVEVAFGELSFGGEAVYAGFMRDVTERRAAERMLRERDHLQRTLLDAAPAMLWTADTQGRTTYTSPRWNEFTGLSSAEALGRGWAAAVHPEDRERMLALIDSRARFATEFTAEYRLRRADGRYRWILDQGVPRYAPDGGIEGYIGCCVDIHARVVAERRLRRQTSAYEVLTDVNEAIARVRDGPALMQRVCDSIVAYGGMHAAWVGLVDADRRVLRSVASAGQTYSEFDRIAIDLGGDDPLERTPAVAALRSGEPVVINDRASDPAAEAIRGRDWARTVKASCTLPIREGERVVGVLCVYAAEVDVFDDDLTRLLTVLADDLSFGLESMREQAGRAAAETELRRLAATLEQKVADRTLSLAAANQELEAFSYSVSHDLRAPLRAVNGFTALAIEQAGAALDDVSRGYLDRVKAAAVRMSDLINDLLDLSRVTRAQIQRGRVDVTAVAREIVAELAASEPGRVVEARVAPGLTVDADPGLARTLLANLIGNAWKFSAGRERARVDVEAGELGGAPAIVVRDNGAGFDMAHADKLFTPFQRLHSEREFPGTGIGLALVRRIVTRHGGEVTVVSAPGEGTIVRVSFGSAV